jgi:integrase
MRQASRRTLKFIAEYPTPQEIFERIRSSPGWPYKANMEQYMKRDKALVSLLYLLALRISEALRLKREQFTMSEQSPDRVIVKGIKLSKSKIKDKPRKEQYRQEGFLALHGPRAELTRFVIDYLETIQPEDKLFNFGNSRALQITHAILGIPNHWLRAYGEDYLYQTWDHDILAVADYVKVDPRTLQEYIRKRYGKYQIA